MSTPLLSNEMSKKAVLKIACLRERGLFVSLSQKRAGVRATPLVLFALLALVSSSSIQKEMGAAQSTALQVYSRRPSPGCSLSLTLYCELEVHSAHQDRIHPLSNEMFITVT